MRVEKECEQRRSTSRERESRERERVRGVQEEKGVRVD